MSKANVEIVRTAVQAFNRGDVDASFKDTAADFEYDLSRANGPFRGVYGIDEAHRVFQEFSGTWESVRLAPDEFIDGGEHIVTPVTLGMRGRDGIEVEAQPAFVWTVREGKVSRLCMYQERDEAMEAAGLTADPD